MSETLTWEILARDRMSEVLEKLSNATAKLDKNLTKTGNEAQVMGRKLSEAEPHAGRLSRSLDGLAGGAERALGFLKNLGIGAAITLGTAAVAGGAFAIKAAADNETARVSFDLLLGSAEKAGSFLKDLQKFAAATPFDMPTLRDAASRLLAVGVEAKDVIPIMTRLGDATAGMGTGAEGIQRAVYALQQMRQSGKVQLDDINQLTDAGIPALDALAAHFHKTVAEVRDMISNGNVKADDLFSAIQNGEGQAFGRLKGMMDKQSATLTGVWSTFKDNLSQTLAQAVEPALPKLKKLLDFGAQAIPAVIGGLQSYAGKIGDIFKGSDVGKDIMDRLEKFGRDMLPQIKRAADDVLKTIRDNREGLEKFGHMIANDVIPAVEWLAKNALPFLVSGIEMIIISVAHFVDAWNAARAYVIGMVKVMVDGILALLGMIVDGAAKAFGWIPGLGEKFRSAQRDFHSFVDSVNAELDRLSGKRVTTYIDTVYHTSGSRDDAGNYHSSGVQFRASGGGIPRAAGGVYRVGENGPEELYLPGGARVKPNNQMTAGAGGADVIGVLRVDHYGPSGEYMRTEFLKLANRKGYRTLDKLLPVGQ